jgi:hypothetical protein
MKCSECGQILSADVVKCTNCGVPVNATLRYREVDEPITALPTVEPAVVDLTALDVVDLRELVSQLNDEVPVDAEAELDPEAMAMATSPPAIREAWDVQSKNATILWPQKTGGPRPTTDDITPRR